MSSIIIKCLECGFVARNKEELLQFRLGDIKKGKGYCQMCYKIMAKNNVKRILYSRWRSMIYRCYNPKDTGFRIYGARGITVCEEWRNNRQAFFDWANTHGFKPELEIDRIDNNGSYSPENCRWVTHSENQRNKNKQITRMKIR